MAEFGSELNNNWLSLVVTVGRVDDWRPSSLVLVQAAWACDRLLAWEVDRTPQKSTNARKILERNPLLHQPPSTHAVWSPLMRQALLSCSKTINARIDSAASESETIKARLQLGSICRGFKATARIDISQDDRTEARYSLGSLGERVPVAPAHAFTGVSASCSPSGPAGPFTAAAYATVARHGRVGADEHAT